jgi:hypothetical protein
VGALDSVRTDREPVTRSINLEEDKMNHWHRISCEKREVLTKVDEPVMEKERNEFGD